MSATKRDHYQFRHAPPAARTVLRSVPSNNAARPELELQTLSLQVSWNDGPKQGSDPYNTVGTRTRP
jgi:hypothetical protein